MQICLCRYIASDGCALVVRPTGKPEGLKVFKFVWNRASRSVEVFSALNGGHVASVPGKWGPMSRFSQACCGRAGFICGALWCIVAVFFSKQRLLFIA